MAYYTDGQPWNMSPGDLESWFKETIEEGSTRYAIECNRSMDRLVGLLQHIPKVKVKEVRKAGSMEKGTYFKDSSDIDCIVILQGTPKLAPGIKTGHHRQKILKPGLKKILKALQSNKNSSFVQTSEKVSNLQLGISVRQDDGSSLEIDILLTADNLDYEDPSKKDMLRNHYNFILGMQQKEQRFIYQPCLTPLQTEFVKSQPGDVKKLIRLLKFWKAEYLQKSYAYDGKKLINSYTLELLAIAVYEDDLGSTFDLSVGFKYVMSLIANNLDGFEWYWTTYYSKEMAKDSVRRLQSVRSVYFKETPVLLDPSDPSDNVLARWMNGLDKVMQAARNTLNTRLMRNVSI